LYLKHAILHVNVYKILIILKTVVRILSRSYGTGPWMSPFDIVTEKLSVDLLSYCLVHSINFPEIETKQFHVEMQSSVITYKINIMYIALKLLTEKD
jgi:hypothetical protein